MSNSFWEPGNGDNCLNPAILCPTSPLLTDFDFSPMTTPISLPFLGNLPPFITTSPSIHHDSSPDAPDAPVIDLKVDTLPTHCFTCGSTLIHQHPPYTVGLYSLAITMPPTTRRAAAAAPSVQPPIPSNSKPASAAPKTRGKRQIDAVADPAPPPAAKTSRATRPKASDSAPVTQPAPRRKRTPKAANTKKVTAPAPPPAVASARSSSLSPIPQSPISPPTSLFTPLGDPAPAPAAAPITPAPGLVTPVPLVAAPVLAAPVPTPIVTAPTPIVAAPIPVAAPAPIVTPAPVVTPAPPVAAPLPVTPAPVAQIPAPINPVAAPASVVPAPVARVSARAAGNRALPPPKAPKGSKTKPPSTAPALEPTTTTDLRPDPVDNGVSASVPGPPAPVALHASEGGPVIQDAAATAMELLQARLDASEKKNRELVKYKKAYIAKQIGSRSTEAHRQASVSQDQPDDFDPAAEEFPQSTRSSVSTSSGKGKAPVSQRLIPRPQGERGKHWVFKKGVQLEQNPEEHKAILYTARTLTLQCGLNHRVKWADQPRKQLNLCFDHLRATHPYLLQFEGDWATREYVHNALYNRRKMARQRSAKKEKLGASGEAGNSASGSATASNDIDGDEDDTEDDED